MIAQEAVPQAAPGQFMAFDHGASSIPPPRGCRGPCDPKPSDFCRGPFIIHRSPKSVLLILGAKAFDFVAEIC